MQRRPHLQKFIFRLSVDVDVVNVVVVVVVVVVADEDVAVTQINVAKLLSMSVFPRCC